MEKDNESSFRILSSTPTHDSYTTCNYCVSNICGLEFACSGSTRVADPGFKLPSFVHKSEFPKPKDRLTVPKMENNATALSVRVAHILLQALKKKVRTSSTTILSNSKIILCWLATYPIKDEVRKLVKFAQLRSGKPFRTSTFRFDSDTSIHMRIQLTVPQEDNKEEAIEHIGGLEHPS